MIITDAVLAIKKTLTLASFVIYSSVVGSTNVLDPKSLSNI
jgi:hypothetical protein